MKLTIEGPTTLNTPVGRATSSFANALRDLGLPVVLEGCTAGADQVNDVQRARGDRSSGLLESATLHVRIRRLRQPTMRTRGDDAKLVLHQTWEFGPVPLAWLEPLHAADAIWVPSLDVKDGYVRSGIPADSIWVVPEGASTHTAVTPSDASSPITFLFLGGASQRNGLDLLVSALDALRDDELNQVTLLVDAKDWYSAEPRAGSASSIVNTAPRVARRTMFVDLRSVPPDRPLRVTALVHPYRAESFGSPILEAMATGIPTIVTGGGATDAYCTDETAFRIAATVDVFEQPSIDGLVTSDFPRTLTPSVEAIVQHLRTIISDQDRVAPVAAAAYRMAQQYRWQDCAREASSAITALATGAIPEDRFTRTAGAVGRFLSSPSPQSWVAATQHLLGVNDPHGALRLADLAMSLIPAREVARVRHGLTGTTSNRDTWSAADWRVNIAALSHTMRTEGVAHRYEGDLAAVTRIALSIAPYFSESETVLDIGCGKGAMLRTLRSSGVKVTGVDGDPDLVACLRDEEAFEVYEAWLPEGLAVISDRKFDGMFLGHIIEHLTTGDATSVLSWASQHLNDDGLIVIQTPDFSIDFVSGTNFWLDPTHVRPYPLDLLKSLLEGAGFSPIASGCRSLAPDAPLDVLAVGKLRRPKVRALPAVSRGHRTAVHIGLFSGTSGMSVQARRLFDEHLLASNDLFVERIDLGANPSSALSEVLALTSHVAVVDVPPGWLPTLLPYVRAAKTVIRLAYEATPLPGHLARRVAAANEIWTMSRFVSDACRAAGVPSQMLIDLPVHVPVSSPRDGRDEPRLPAPTTFSSVFNFESRKNPEALLMAFNGLLVRGHDARLLIKTGGIDAAHFWQWCASRIDSKHIDLLRHSIELHTETLGEAQLRALLARSDAFVLPTRGEGFGIPFLEAMGQGLPIVCPDQGGHREFATEKNALLVRSRQVPCSASCDLDVFREAFWFEVDVHALTDAMEIVALHPESVRELSLGARHTALEWSLRDVAGEASTRLLSLFDASR